MRGIGNDLLPSARITVARSQSVPQVNRDQFMSTTFGLDSRKKTNGRLTKIKSCCVSKFRDLPSGQTALRN